VPSANPTRGAFLAKLEKTAAAVGASRPRLFPDCVVNAASYLGGGFAPGEIVTLFGSAIGPSEPVPLRLAEDGRLATTLAGTQVLFDGVPAPLPVCIGHSEQCDCPLRGGWPLLGGCTGRVQGGTV
jgi:hypothetical protein